MGDRSMKTCLEEMLKLLRSSLPKGTTAQGWYDDGCDESQLQCVGANVNGLRAWGYLQGAADALDVTVLTLLDEHGLRFDAPSAKRKVKSEAICPKCESKRTHRCKTGDEGCWHCDDCGHLWLASKSFSRAKGAPRV